MKRSNGQTVGRSALIGLLLTVGPSARLAAQCPDGSPAPCRVARAAALMTVAVLPFDNLSRDTGDAYLASGLTEEITTRLTQIERFTVTSAVVMRRYRTGSDPLRAAAETRVAHLVAGSVRRDRNRLRVSVELLNGRSGVTVWRHAYNQPDTMLLDMQAQIAEAVAAEITGALLPEERARVAVRPRRNPRAYDAYMRGVYDAGQRTLPSLQRAIRSYERAARLDSTYAAPLAGLAQAWSLLANTYYDASLGMSRESLMNRARANARAAFQVDTTAAESWAVMAYQQPDAAGRRAYAERALALDPNNAEVLYFYSGVLASVGDEAGHIAALQRAIAADPTRPVPILSLGMYHLRERRFAEALRWLDSAVTFAPEAYYFYSDRGLARLHTGDTAGVRRDAAETRRRGNPITADALLALLAARIGDSVGLRSLAAALETTVATQACVANFDCLAVAGVLVAAGERERALALLERSSGRSTGWMLGWLGMVEFDPVRNDPRFQALVALPPPR